jgi:regulator of replication initiation timing
MSILTDLAKWAQTVLTLSKDLEQNRADIKELRRDFMNLAMTVQRLADEIKLNNQQESSARENLALRLENEMLKFERRLPPAKSSDDQD